MLCKALIDVKKKNVKTIISGTRTSAHIGSQESKGYCLLCDFDLAGLIVIKCK